MQYSNPLIVQSDKTLLLDVHAPLAEECRNALIPFAELERSPEHLHTYRLSPLSLWNATSAGITTEQIINSLEKFAKYDIPSNIKSWIEDTSNRFGKIKIKGIEEDNEEYKNYLYLETENELVYRELDANKTLSKYLIHTDKKNTFLLLLINRGTIKQELLKLSWPVKDEAPLVDGEHLEIKLRNKCLSNGKNFSIREYQKKAGEAVIGDRGPGTGFGTIVLPCGSGKTVVGINIMSMLQTNTLILTTNISAVHQWISELLDKTELTEDQIGEYTGENKSIKPITVATYQILTWRPEKNGDYPHFQIFRENHWGLIIYDEVHLLPAPVFRVTAELQTVRRVGLTATLVREDGCEGYVFSLVGPKRFDVPWKELESTGFIASAECVEIRIDLDKNKELDYAVSNQRDKYKIASVNANKIPVVKSLVEKFTEDKILVIGQYLDQLDEVAKLLDAPIITGKTTNTQRDILYKKFREGEIRVLVVSKVANFAIDLPDASMAIQISGTFGSRQEEAQRLGRILRPKERTSKFFTLITRDTVEENFGANRQKFLAEQGYSYKLIRNIQQLEEFY